VKWESLFFPIGRGMLRAGKNKKVWGFWKNPDRRQQGLQWNDQEEASWTLNGRQVSFPAFS
jgi:hypothetical protein